MGSKVCMLNMRNTHVALLILSCSLWFSKVSAVKFEEFLGYPFGGVYGYSAFPSGVDQVRGVAIPTPFTFFGQIYNFANIDDSGYVSFINSTTAFPTPFTPRAFPFSGPSWSALVAAFWADISTTGSGTTYYKSFSATSSSDQPVLSGIDTYVRTTIPELNRFQASWALIVTWEAVGYYPAHTDLLNTFQIVVATNGAVSLAIFNYAEGGINWVTSDDNGGVNGFGGTPAIAGYNAGDGIRSFTIPQSMTDNIQFIDNTTGNTGNVGQWVFRIDSEQSFTFAKCQDSVSLRLPLQLFPSVGHVFGGTPVLVSGLCVDPPHQDITCAFGSETKPGTYLSRQGQFLCIAPAMKKTGRVEFKMMVKDMNGISYVRVASFFYVSYNQGHKVQMSNCRSSVVTDSCIALGSGMDINPRDSVTLQWDKEILPYEGASSYTVDIILYEVNTATASLHVLETLYSNVANSGAQTVTIPARKEQIRTGLLRDAPPIAVVLNVAAKTPTIPLQQAGVWTGIIFLAGGPQWLRHECRVWDSKDEDVVDIGVLPCPPMANQARLPNSGLIEESYESIYGSTTYHQQFTSTFHPGAESCFLQRERLISGVGTQCCYDTDGDLMVDWFNGGSIDKSAPVDYISSIMHIQDDLLPYIFCCTAKSCDTYYENRPPVNDVGWSPPIPACIYGDPHIVTLDGHKYTFNGKGEFILIETDNGTFSLQGRMAEAINSFGQEAGATVFTSLVLKEVDSDTVQVDLTPDGLVALVNGEKVDFGNMTKLEFDQVNVEKGANQTITVTFGSGTFMEVTSANDIISTMVVSLPTVMQGLTRGLMGNYNGNITDDLQSKNESTTVPLNSSLEDIHYSFGITWIIDSANDSLFSYGANESWSDFYSPDFAPLFDLDLNSSQSLEAFDVCEGDLFCIFDIAATGNMAIGLTTLSGSQELEMINNLSAPVICDPPCGIGVCMPNNTCHCPTGYIGANCSVPVFEPCVDNICDNNATCTQHVETVTCECPDGYEGSLCEEPICNPPCVAGFCAQINICQCVSGYTGSTCSIAVPTLPLNVTVEAVTNTSFRVTWQPPIFPLFGLIEYYEIEIYSNFLGLINTSANATVVTFNDLLPGTNYTVRVRAHTSVGGPFTEAELIQTLLEPSIPVNLTVTSTGSTSIFVFWEPPLRFVGDILYYEITFRGIESPNQINSTFYQTSNLFSIATSVQINSYAIMPFSTYNVSVRAVNDVGPGPFSNEVLVRTIADAPSPPESLQPLSISARNITVTWDLPLNPNGIISFYQIELMSADGSITQQNSTQTVAAFTNLSPSAPYSIKVQAFTVEFGEFGPVLMVSTLAVSPEGLVYVMPQNVTADPGCSVVFTCMTTGGPGNTFQWSHNGLLLQGENNSMLMLSDVSAQSGGYYSCEVTNEAGNGSDFGIAFINPIFLEDPMPVTIIFDGSGNMTCTAKGFPAPMVTWMFGGAQAEQPVMESFLPGDALAIVSVLLFTNVTYGSVGNYTCVASLPFITIEYNNTTSHTVTSISAYLLVQGVPESPFNVTVLETTSSSIFLTWLEPFGNNAPIIRYIVIFNDSSNGEVGAYTVEGDMEVANIMELKPFTEYAVRIFAANSVGQSSPSEQELVTTAEDVPSPPLNVTVANKTSTAVLVTWLLPVAPNGVLTSYEIRYMGVSSLNPVPMSFYRDTTAVVSTLLTMHEVEDLVPSSYYAISVRAFTSVGAGQFSKMVIGGTEEDAPSSPRNVTVVNETSTTLLVTWLTPSIPNGVVINYQVNYTGFTSVNLVPTSFFQPQFITIPANETSVVLLDLVPYSKYTIVVRAYTSAGPGEPSEEIEDRTEEDVPASPLNVTIANSTSTIQLLVTWLPPSMPNGVLTNYEVIYTGVFSVNPVPDSFFQSHFITVSAENTSLELQHLVPYSNYTFSVRAYTSVGPGNYSKGIEDRTEEDVPSVPLNVTLAIKSPTIMVVTWLPPFTPNGVITSYGVNYTGVSSVNPVPPSFYQPVSIEVSPPSTSLVLPGLAPHSNYTISVRAFTNAGPGEYSKAIEGRTDQHTPSVPLNVTVLNKTSTSLLITWLPPTAPNGVITSYEVYYRGVFSESLVPASFYQPLSITVYAPSTSLLLEGVFPYSNYTISVRAFTNAGPGEYSEVIEDRTEEDVPSVPVNVTVANKTSTTLLVIWLPPSVPNGILVTFGVQFMGISSENPVPLSFYQVQYINVPFPESSVLLQHLVPYSIYTISVRAYTSVGPGEYSNEIEDRTEQDFPSSPRNVTVVYKTPTSLLVTWDFPFIPNGVLTMYEVTYTGVSSVNPVPDSFFQLIYITVSSANTSLVLQHLVPYSNYTISVRAYTSVGPGKYSQGIEDRTEEDVPSSPLNVTVANKTSTTLLVTWLPPAIPNGVLTNFELCYTGVYSVNPVPSSFHQLQCKNIPFPAAYSLLEDLVPYSNYTISVRAVTSAGPGNSSTEIKGITKEDAPSSPLNVTVLDQTPTSLLVTWASPFIPNGVLTMYEVNYTGVSSGNPVPDSFFQPLYITASAPNTSLAVQQLVPYSNYTISVRAVTSAGPGEPSERIEDRTEEDAPSVPVNVTVASKTSTTLLVTWLPPAIPNGVLTSYEVYYRGLSSVNPVLPSFYQALSVTLSTVSTSIELVNLVPYSDYTLSVRALTSGGPGEYSEQVEARTEEDVPVLGHINATTNHYNIFMQWTLLFPNGIIRYYIVELRSNDGSVTRSLTTQNTSISIDSLPPAMTFTIQVCGFTIVCSDSYTLTTATTGVQPEIFPQGGVKILKSSKDDSIVVAFVVAQAIPPATREQISWVFTSSSGQISIPCANNSEYTFSDDCLSLHIPRVAHKHGGKYQLFARTRAGMGSNAVTLVVTGVPPHVLSPLSNLTISFIEHLRLECAVVADPAPVLVWRFGAQRVVHDNDKYIISTNTSWSSLTVTKLGIPDGGMYMCSASNRYGTESTTAHVTIQVPPSLMLYPSSTRRVPSGGELIATCVATAEPPASIVWFKEGENLTDNVSTELTQGNMTTSRLMFESFTPADSSLYSCMASNFLGNDTATFFISTRENQSISSIELVSGSHSSSVFDAGAVTVEELDDLNVSCTARGSPPPKVAWLKDGILLQSQHSVRRKIQLTQTNQSETVTLHVTELLPTDAGMYTCIVIGGGVSSIPEETTWSFRLIVNAINACIASPCRNGGQCIDTVGDYICQCQKQGSVYYTGKHCDEVANAPSAPAIINNPKNQKNELNSPVSLTCEAVGNPMPVIQWFKDGVQLRGSGAVGNKYIIPELGAADRGSYHCEASNGFRDPVKSSEATVIVTGLVQVSVEVVQQGASTGKRKRQSEPTVDLVPRLELLAIDAQLVLDDDTSAVIVSVKKAAVGPMVFTLSANSSQPPWVISGLVESPLRRLLQEYSDILPGYDFQVNEVQRHDGCASVVDSSCSKGSTIVWPETEIGETVTVSCPCGSPRSSLLPALKATRSCGGNYNNGAQWEDAFCGDCQFHDSRLMLCELSQTDSPSLLARLLAMTTQDASVFSSDDVLLTVALLDAIIVSVSDISMEQVQRDVLLIISNTLGTEPEELLISQQNAMSSTRLLQVVQTVVESVGSVPFVFSAPYFGLIVEDVGNQTHQIFMPNLATLVAAVANKTEMLPNVSSAQLVSSASASVSGSVLAHGSRVATTIFTHDSLFQQRPNFTSVREEQRKQVGSIIMQVAIVGSLVTVTSNEDPAMYTFTKTETASESGERPACHTWNTTLDDEYGAWSNDNCVVTSVYGDELQCACTSLSYTTVRFDVGGGESPQIYYVRWVAVLGPSVAIICIGILLVLYLSNRNWRSSSHGMMLTNISLLLALFGLFLSYIVAAVSPSVPALCAIASASVHYFLLATFCWKLVEAVVMYRKTTASPKDMKYGQVISSLVCWLSPALIVALSIAPRYQNYINPLFCHSYNLSFWLGMVVPVIVICGATWTTYCLTMPNFICSLDKDGCTHCKSKRGQLWRKVFFTAIALSLLLSVVWITGCLVLLALPTSSQKAVDGIFTLLAIAYGVTTLTGHCLRPQMQSCTFCCHSQDESSSQNSCTISTTTTKSTLGRHHSEMEDFSTTSKPTEIGMQAITLINHQAAATNDALDSQSFHIAFGATDEAGRELHGGDDISSEDNAASPFNLKEHGECLVMENRMADDAL